MLKIAIARNTFRIHDNPLLFDPPPDILVCFIDAERCPSVNAFAAADLEDTRPYAFGPHQYAFLLQIIASHLQDIHAKGCVPVATVFCGTIKGLSQYISRICDGFSAQTHPQPVGVECCLDYVDDTSAVHNDSTFEHHFHSIPNLTLSFKNTLTMIDWRDFRFKHGRDSLKRWMSIRFRNEIHGMLVHPYQIHYAPKTATSARHVRKVEKVMRRVDDETSSITCWKGRVSLLHAIEIARARMDQAGLHAVQLQEGWPSSASSATPHPPGLECTVSAALLRTANGMCNPKWQKKDTAANETLTDTASDPLKRCSHLSPFFAIGALSARRAYEFWYSSHCRPEQRVGPPHAPPETGSAPDQLLFREIYHCTSLLPGFWKSYLPKTTADEEEEDMSSSSSSSSSSPSSPWKESSYWEEPPFNKASLHVIKEWIMGQSDASDMNDSMVLLRTTGWIHHLRRHVVADYLTRGNRKIHWELGERWFRHALVDHDASVNRGNWLWLSATAYSYGQRFKHYRHSDYITRPDRPGYPSHSSPCVSNVILYSKKTKSLIPKQGDAVRRTIRSKHRPPSSKKKLPTLSKKDIRDTSLEFTDPLLTKKEKETACSSPQITSGTITHEMTPTFLPVRNTNTEWIFQDAPQFRPNMSPEEVLRAGSFGGTYFRPILSKVTHISYYDAYKEFPEEWFSGISIDSMVTSSTYTQHVNTYKVGCGTSLHAWQCKGWINPLDPYGWFQWYCRFWSGRRCTDDTRQINRFNKIAGPTGRFRKQLINKCTKIPTTFDDMTVSPVIRQTLQHWGYVLTLNDFQN
jgi:hypothetical protein